MPKEEWVGFSVELSGEVLGGLKRVDPQCQFCLDGRGKF